MGMAIPSPKHFNIICGSVVGFHFSPTHSLTPSLINILINITMTNNKNKNKKSNIYIKKQSTSEENC